MNELIKAYDQVLESTVFLKGYGEPSFSPSILGSKCMRKIFYAYSRVDKDYGMPVENLRKCDHGNFLHHMITKAWRKAGILVDYFQPDGKPKINRFTKELDLEFPLEDPDLQIKAKTDAILILEVNGKKGLWIGEIKSIKSKDYQTVARTRKPKDEHLRQGVSYLYIFNKLLAEGTYKHIPKLAPFTKVEGIKFVYHNKDEDVQCEIDVIENETIFMELLEKMDVIREHYKNQTLPPTAFDFCKTCEYRKKCVQNRLK